MGKSQALLLIALTKLCGELGQYAVHDSFYVEGGIGDGPWGAKEDE